MQRLLATVVFLLAMQLPALAVLVVFPLLVRTYTNFLKFCYRYCL